MKLPQLSAFLFSVLVFCILGIAAFIRIINLDTLPASLYWEEAALGYDAFAISQTGRDHHGQTLPVVAFTSFGDYKPSGYFYAIVPFISLIGLSEWSVRLPSALAGISIVVGIGVFVAVVAGKIWSEQQRVAKTYGFLIGSLCATFSPWLIQFSRGGWEVNLATALLLWSVLMALFGFGQRSGRTRLLLLIAASLFAALSMYVYHATRVVAPALLASLYFMEWIEGQSLQHLNLTKLRKKFMSLLIPGVVFLLLVLPILLSSQNSTTQQRFAETSIASDGQYVTDSNTFREASGNTIFSKVFGHRYLFLARDVAEAFSSHFTLNFLFISGDTNPRHSTGFTGILLLTDLPWLLIGSLFIAAMAYTRKELRPLTAFLLWWLCIGIFPAAITKAHPHALRILPTAPVFILVVSIGILQAISWLRSKLNVRVWSATLLITGLFIIAFWSSYWRFYTRIYRVESQAEWQYGYKQMIAQLNELMAAQQNARVYVTREYGRPAMYYWFYSQTNPRDVQAADATAAKDQGEFLVFDRIQFINTVNEAKPGIVVSSLSGYEKLMKQHSSIQKLSEVRDERGNVVWVLSQFAQ